jgi:hypothetical protein
MISNSFDTFCPQGTATIAATTASAAVALPIGAGSERPQVRVYNAGINPAFIAFGVAGVTATVNDIPIHANTTSLPEKFTVPFGATHVACILSTGTGTVYFTSGFGA